MQTGRPGAWQMHDPVKPHEAIRIIRRRQTSHPQKAYAVPVAWLESILLREAVIETQLKSFSGNAVQNSLMRVTGLPPVLLVVPHASKKS